MAAVGTILVLSAGWRVLLSALDDGVSVVLVVGAGLIGQEMVAMPAARVKAWVS